MKTFGDLVDLYIKKRRFSLRDIEAISGLTFGAVSYIRNNKRQPTLDSAIKLIKALEIPLEEVLEIYA